MFGSSSVTKYRFGGGDDEDDEEEEEGNDGRNSSALKFDNEREGIFFYHIHMLSFGTLVGKPRPIF